MIPPAATATRSEAGSASPPRFITASISPRWGWTRRNRSAARTRRASADFCSGAITMSARASSRSTRSQAAGASKLSATLRLPALCSRWRKPLSGSSRSARCGPAIRSASPAAASTRITSAPRSAKKRPVRLRHSSLRSMMIAPVSGSADVSINGRWARRGAGGRGRTCGGRSAASGGRHRGRARASG